MDRIAAFNTIAAAAGRGELAFPASVAASVRLQQALVDPDCHVDLAARLIGADPLLAARTMAIANSVAFNRSGTPISSVRAAVHRLGVRTLQALVAALIVRQLAAAPADAGLRAKAAQLWEHTAHTAALAQVIARRVTHVDPDTALFAGIVHEVGAFYALSCAGTFDGTFDGAFAGLFDGAPHDWIGHGEPLVGTRVLDALMVPQRVVCAVAAMWAGMRAVPPETLGDTLLLADDLAPVPSPMHARHGCAAPQAARTIDCAVGEGTLRTILDESRHEVQSLHAALML